MTISAGCLGAVQGCPRVVAPILHFWSTYMEGHCAIDLFLDSKGSSSQTCLSSVGMKQVPPDIVDTSVYLHRISLQGKLDKDWVQEHAVDKDLVQEHAVYVDRWTHRKEHIADALALDGDTTYLAAYMESYRRTTRRYITRDLAYWEILVRQQFDTSFMD